MSQDNIGVLRDQIEAFCAKDWSRFKATLSDDAVYMEKPTQRRVQGAEAIMQLVKGWADAFPDPTAKIIKTFAAGDTAVVELEWQGTHKGPLAGPMGSIPPTGKRGKVDAIQIATFERGKVKELHHYFDLVTLLQQLGAMPMKKAA